VRQRFLFGEESSLEFSENMLIGLSLLSLRELLKTLLVFLFGSMSILLAPICYSAFCMALLNV